MSRISLCESYPFDHFSPFLKTDRTSAETYLVRLFVLRCYGLVNRREYTRTPDLSVIGIPGFLGSTLYSNKLRPHYHRGPRTSSLCLRIIQYPCFQGSLYSSVISSLVIYVVLLILLLDSLCRFMF